MDFSALLPKNKDQIDWNEYPFTACAFYKNRGASEPETLSKKSSFPTKEAKIIIILHTDHTTYFSQESVYKPFMLAPGN